MQESHPSPFTEISNKIQLFPYPMDAYEHLTAYLLALLAGLI